MSHWLLRPVLSELPLPPRGQVASTHEAAKIRSGNFLMSPGADGFFIGPGATILVTAVLLTLRALGPQAERAADAIAVGLNWGFIGPHYTATYRRPDTSLACVRAPPSVTLAAPRLLLAAAAPAGRLPVVL